MFKMSLKHKAFADEYLVNGMNGQRAYMKVYNIIREDTARVNASKLLTNPNIKDYISAAQKELEKKQLISKEEVIQRLLQIQALHWLDTKGAPSAVRALENINKMLGYNEAEKIDIKAEIENKTLRDYLDFDNE
jgi:phage terminase small subunit